MTVAVFQDHGCIPACRQTLQRNGALTVGHGHGTQDVAEQVDNVDCQIATDAMDLDG